MNLSALLGGGDAPTLHVRPVATDGSVQPAADAATVEVAALEMHASTTGSVRRTVGNAFRSASAPLWSAVSTLNSRFRHFAAMARGARPTIVTGMAARVLPVDDSYAVLQATRPILADPLDEAWFDEDADAPLPSPAWAIWAGSFTVNSVVIPVEADDAIHRVLDRITASDAGVTARYDEDTATVTLAAKSGSAPIVLADDSSGFLAAVHLDDAVDARTFPRMRSAFATAFSRMSEYADVHAGVVTINGQPIVIDPVTTTINGFIASVDSSPDVCAVLDQAAGDITLSSRVGGATITLTDTSGLLSVLNIGEGVHGNAVVLKPVEERAAPVTAATHVEPPPVVASAQPAQRTPFSETQAGRMLVAEQAQGALLLSTTFKPRSADGAARIRTAPVSERRVKRMPTAPPPDEPSPANQPDQTDQTDQQALDGETAIEVSSPPEVLQPLLDMFIDRAGMGRGDGRAAAASWWRW